MMGFTMPGARPSDLPVRDARVGRQGRIVRRLSAATVALWVATAASASPPTPGQIFVTDQGNHRIVRVNDMTGAGWTTVGGPAAGSGIRQFSAPGGIFVSPRGQIFVADSGNHRVVRINDMGGAGWMAVGTGGGVATHLRVPVGVAVSST
jgi:hypothetical protein